MSSPPGCPRASWGGVFFVWNPCFGAKVSVDSFGACWRVFFCSPEFSGGVWCGLSSPPGCLRASWGGVFFVWELRLGSGVWVDPFCACWEKFFSSPRVVGCCPAASLGVFCFSPTPWSDRSAATVISPKFAFTRKIWVFSGLCCWGKTFFAALCEAYSPKTPFTAELSSSFEKKLSCKDGEIYVTDEEELEWDVDHGWQGGTSATGALGVHGWDAAQQSLTRSRLGTGHGEIKLDCESREV